jgi:uncharacterized protein involved in propanediol utilization
MRLGAPSPQPNQPQLLTPGLTAGVGYAIAHHGEVLQGVFADSAGRMRRALVTMPLASRGSRAVFYPSQSHWGVVGSPGLTKARRAAIYTLREFAAHPAPAKGGRVEITSNIPHGIGMGSSTSDVTATIKAVADYYGISLSREEVGRLAVLAEVASDSVMIDDRVVLFAHRDGVVLETFGHRLPPMIVVGCDTAPGQAVETLSLPLADYSDSEAGEFQVLRGALRRAIATEDISLLGKVATASARINQRYLPKPGLEPLIGLCLRRRGAGLQIAHSGTVAGLIFDARRPGIDLEGCVQGIKELGFAVTDIIEPARPQARRRAQLAAVHP